VKKIILPILIAVFLFGCHGKKKKGDDDTSKGSGIASNLKDLSSERQIIPLICQRWVNKEDQESYDNSNGIGNVNFPYRSMHFFPDFTVVKYPYMDLSFGKWGFDEATKTIHIQYENGEQEAYLIKAIGAKDMMWINQANPGHKIEMTAEGLVEKNSKEDPFYYSNELWRNKPTHAESETEIRERVRQCIHFYHLYLRDNAGRNEPSIMFRGLPSCFSWYTGGIGMQDKDKLDEQWINCFYDKDEAMQAYSIINDEVMTKKYDWGDSTETNWIKQSASVLKQMGDSLK